MVEIGSMRNWGKRIVVVRSRNKNTCEARRENEGRQDGIPPLPRPDPRFHLSLLLGWAAGKGLGSYDKILNPGSLPFSFCTVGFLELENFWLIKEKDHKYWKLDGNSQEVKKWIKYKIISNNLCRKLISSNYIIPIIFIGRKHMYIFDTCKFKFILQCSV